MRTPEEMPDLEEKDLRRKLPSGIATNQKGVSMKPRTELSMQLYDMLVDRGYPEPLCELISRNLNTDYTATRMIGYLSHYSNLPDLEIVDEMLAILSERNALIQKKEAEQTQVKMNEIYRLGLDVEEQQDL